MFLDIFKAFDIVWHNELLFKLKKDCAIGDLFQLITSCLSGRFQTVLLNDQASDWKTIQADVPQRSILGSLFFHRYIKDQANN